MVTDGTGLTVTVIAEELPTQPNDEIGITIYCIDPAVVLLGLAKVWLMLLPAPLLAPTMPPVFVPKDQTKEFVPGVEAVSPIFGDVPLQVLAVDEVVTTGAGLTVTVIVNGEPVHKPVTEVGVTIYFIVAAVVLLVFVRTWLMVDPEPLLAPVTVPVPAAVVHVKVLGVLAVKLILGEVPLQVVAVVELVTAGVGLTVTVITDEIPAHDPVVVAVGVTLYCTVPAEELLRLVSVWFMVEPAPLLAPVMLPVIVPIVHAKVPGRLAVKLILGPVPLQVEAVNDAFVIVDCGLTVTVIVYGEPVQPPVVEVGVIIYWTVPAVVLLGLVNTWLIEEPAPLEAPVIPPVIVPTVQVNVLAALAVKLIAGLDPLQVVAVVGFVTVGIGFTVTVIINVEPEQEPVIDVGVMTYCTVPGVALLGLVNVWLIIDPELLLAPVIPPVIVPIVQVKVLGVLAVKLILGPVPLQVLAVFELVTVGFGLTVTVIAKGVLVQEPVVEVGTTLYWTVPVAELLGLVNVWLIVEPELLPAPVMLPVIVPIVHANELGAVAVRLIFGPVPLQVLAVDPLEINGVGLTVTVIA
jgi:hypothetical protein